MQDIVKFSVIRIKDEALLGDVSLNKESSKLYREGSDQVKRNIKLVLSIGASEHFRSVCYIKIKKSINAKNN